MSDENKPSWKEKQKVAPRVKEGLDRNTFLKSREATKASKEAFKRSKKELKLSRDKHIVAQRNYKKMMKEGGKPLSVNHIIAKKQWIENKNGKKVAKRIYQKTKAKDSSRISVQLKTEAKFTTKQEIKQTMLSSLKGDDTLKEGVDAYAKYKRTGQSMRTGLRVGKHTGKLAVKTAKGTYGLGNRFINYTKGRGFQRTPEDFTSRKQLMKKFRNARQRMKVAKEAKKAERGIRLIRSIMNGQKTIAQGAKLLLKSPITWIVLLVIVLIFMLAGGAGSIQKPAIVQEDKDLTDSWVYMTKLDAEHTDSDNVFYSNIDDVMFYMNYRFDDYTPSAMLNTGTMNYEGFLTELWTSLNGKPPDYALKTMNQLETDEKNEYYLAEEEYEHYQEVKEELGYSTLDDPLAFPFQTDTLIVSRRYGYENNAAKTALFNGIEVLTEVGKEFLSPISGKVESVPTESSIVIVSKESARLTLNGVKSTRHKVGTEINVGTLLGTIEKEAVTIHYEKYDRDTKEWFFVNPAFYFPHVTYTQVTQLGMSDFSPSAGVEERAKKVYDYLTKLGYTKEGISAILGNFSVESGINPKRAEGDYLNPPVGASGNSWDDPLWLSMGGLDIYGKFPNIVHRGLGLGQWTDTADGGRRHTLLLDYAKAKNKKWYDLELQLDFIFHGDSPGSRTYADNVAGSKVAATVPELTVYFLNYWEGNPGDKVTERIQAAQNWFHFLSNSGGVVDGSSSDVFEKYKDKMKPLPTDRETKPGQGWPGNAYALGNCTWYVYNRMAQLGKSIHPTMGNANQWITNYAQTPGAHLVATPQRGDAVIFSNGVAGSSALYGHVAFVEHVNSDGSFVISEMNISGEYSMSWRVLKKEAGEYFMRVK